MGYLETEQTNRLPQNTGEKQMMDEISQCKDRLEDLLESNRRLTETNKRVLELLHKIYDREIVV